MVKATSAQWETREIQAGHGFTLLLRIRIAITRLWVARWLRDDSAYVQD